MDSSTTKNLDVVYYWIAAVYSIHSLGDITPIQLTRMAQNSKH